VPKVDGFAIGRHPRESRGPRISCLFKIPGFQFLPESQEMAFFDFLRDHQV
jgi:hypothetical protein